MKITLFGAAGGEITGSAYLLETGHSRLLVDAGMFQGGKHSEEKNRLPEAIQAASLDCILLTHAHLDHSGRIPLVMKAGFRGPIFATEAAIELSEIILEDAARIQQHDAEKANTTPLYTSDDLKPFRQLTKSVDYHTKIHLASGISARYFEAGHMLGSASIEVTVEENGHKHVVLFSGDLGPLHEPFVRKYDMLQQADLVFLESTYGDRDHKPYPETVAEFEQLVVRAAENNGKIIIPTFAVGRAQQIMYQLAILFYEKKVPPFPVYIDSPMAIHATKVFASHPDLYDDEVNAWREKGLFDRFKEYFKPTPSVEESKQLNTLTGPLAILAGSGMCNGGRILHHLKHNLSHSNVSVLIVGYQGEGSLGRHLVDGAKKVRIHGEEVQVNASIHTLNGFSAHAGQSELLHWLSSLAKAKPLIALTHGENRQRQALESKIMQQFQLPSLLPDLFDVIEL